jgi:Zn-dependent protease
MSSLLSYVIDALYSLPGILVGLSFHEWAHAYAAYKRGDPTARNLGRMTVNPLAHIDLIGFISLVILGFGWAKPVPVNTRNFKKPRTDELIVSLAGIIVNLILGALFMILWFVLALLPYSNDILNTMVQYCYVINFSLAVFNLLPIPPLDGYRVVQCLFLNGKTYKVFSFLERYSYVILIAVLLLNSRTHFLNTLVSWVMMPVISLLRLVPSLI